MKSYQRLEMEMIGFCCDVITTSVESDNIVAGKSSWNGWNVEGGSEK